MKRGFCALLCLWFFTPGLAFAESIAIGCSQYGRHEMAWGISLLMVVLLIGQRRRIPPEPTNSSAL